MARPFSGNYGSSLEVQAANMIAAAGQHKGKCMSTWCPDRFYNWNDTGEVPSKEEEKGRGRTI